MEDYQSRLAREGASKAQMHQLTRGIRIQHPNYVCLPESTAHETQLSIVKLEEPPL
jgi:hypothetical protein